MEQKHHLSQHTHTHKHTHTHTGGESMGPNRQQQNKRQRNATRHTQNSQTSVPQYIYYIKVTYLEYFTTFEKTAVQGSGFRVHKGGVGGYILKSNLYSEFYIVCTRALSFENVLQNVQCLLSRSPPVKRTIFRYYGTDVLRKYNKNKPSLSGPYLVLWHCC